MSMDVAGARIGAAAVGLASEVLLRLTLDGKRVTGEERIVMHRRIRDVIQAPGGAVLLLGDGDGGELLRLTPSSQGSR